MMCSRQELANHKGSKSSSSEDYGGTKFLSSYQNLALLWFTKFTSSSEKLGFVLGHKVLGSYGKLGFVFLLVLGPDFEESLVSLSDDVNI
ncbi:unnamed protein product [Calypogeia fissa]